MISVEMNMGQMVNDIKVAIDCKIPVTHFGRTGGVIPSVDEIFGEIVRLDKTQREEK
jgi:2-oxoglutarate ferredoxin oxidoreductase subunit alpha